MVIENVDNLPSILENTLYESIYLNESPKVYNIDTLYENKEIYTENKENLTIQVEKNEESLNQNEIESALLELIVKLSNKNIIYEMDLSEETLNTISKFKSE